MGRYTQTGQVAATPEQAFAAFTDATVLADWMDAKAIRGATGPLDQAGTRFSLVIAEPWRFRSRIVEVERSRRWVAEGHGLAGAWYRQTATLTPADGGTRIELTTEYRVPLGPIGRWLDRRYIEPGPHTAADREFARLLELAAKPA